MAAPSLVRYAGSLNSKNSAASPKYFFVVISNQARFGFFVYTLINHMDPDKKSIERILTGDASAFSGILNRYLKPIYNFSASLTGDFEAAEDISQETFLKVWKNLKHFDQNKSFKTWIFAIAKNTAYDHLKKKKNLPFSYFENEDGTNPLTEIAGNDMLPDEFLERKDAAKILEKKLRGVPEHYRTILILFYKEDFNLREIAEILDLPYNTVKSRHSRALAKLKKELEKKLD